MRVYRNVFGLLLVVLFVWGAAQAVAAGGGYGDPGGGYSGPGPALVTAEQAKGMSDDAWVTLKGHIVRNLGGKHYELKDASGVITLEISEKKWQGQNIGPDDLVEVQGKIDKDLFDLEVEVKRIVKR